MEPDPKHEQFDVLTPEGEPTGTVKARAAVHRDGDWHRSFHCWVAWVDDDGRAQILFQQRSPTKDTVPNHLDVAVGGHYRSGETLDEVIRESDEELGLPMQLTDLIPIGVRRAVGHGPGWTDREIQDVYVHRLTTDVTALRPAPDEITALYVLAADDLVRLFQGEQDCVPATRLPVHPDRSLGAHEQVMVSCTAFVPVTDDYWRIGATITVRALAGERDLDLGLW